MKKTRFSEERIVFALRLGDSGTPVAGVCRQIGISEATFHVRKKKYADPGVAELRRLKMLEGENARLKRLVTGAHARPSAPAGGGAKKALKPLERRELAGCIHERLQVSVQRACRLALLKRSSWHFESQARDSAGAALAHRLAAWGRVFRRAAARRMPGHA